MAAQAANSVVRREDRGFNTSDRYTCCRAAIALMTIEQASQVSLVMDKLLKMLDHFQQVDAAVKNFQSCIHRLSTSDDLENRYFVTYEIITAMTNLEVNVARYKLLLDMDTKELKKREEELMANVVTCKEHLRYLDNYYRGQCPQLPEVIEDLLMTHEYEVRLQGFNNIVRVWHQEQLRSTYQATSIDTEIARMTTTFQSVLDTREVKTDQDKTDGEVKTADGSMDTDGKKEEDDDEDDKGWSPWKSVLGMVY